MSYRTLTTKPLNVSLKTLLKRGGHIGLGLSAFTPVLALANPTGGHVVSGQATIANPSANGTIITQRSNSAIINWQQFNIGAGQFVQFLQPSSSSVVLNRVIGGSPSSILGSLTANGQVFLVNTNGVYFGKGSSIDTQGFLASTLGITDQNFLAHNYVFNQPGANGATVINDGSITSHHGGYVVLAGDYAENDGIISAQSGHVVLASGSKATLALNGNNLVNFAVNQSTLAKYAGVKNTGSILADGGTVIMTADVANLLKSTVVNNTGLVEAHAISKDGGVIQLLASGGNISNAGTLDVSATGKDQAGGDVTLKGDEKTFLANSSNIDANGNGANGGSVEVSGKAIAMRGALALGKGGKLLLDPTSIKLIAGSSGAFGGGTGATSSNIVSEVGVTKIQNALDSGASVNILAHTKIFASGGINAIDAITGATAANGKLTLKVGAGGQIALAGVNIDIAGKFTASMGNGTFGHLTAGSIDLNATGAIKLPAATLTEGTVTTYSARTTVGDLDINANQVVNETSSSAATLALSAKQQLGLSASYHGTAGAAEGNLTLVGKSIRGHRTLFLDGTLTATASNGYADFGNITAKQGINVTTTSGNVEAGNLASSSGAGITVTAGGNFDAGAVFATAGNVIVTATGNVGAESFVANNGTVTVNAGGALDLGHSAVNRTAVFTKKGLNLTAADGIEYLGSGVFTLYGGSGDVVVHGAFGGDSAGEGGVGAGGLLLQTNGGKVQLDHNVFAYGGIAIQGASLAYTGAGSEFKLSAAGLLSLDAAIGTAKAPVAYGVELNALTATIALKRSIYTKQTIDASGSSVKVTPGNAHISTGSTAKITVDDSITLHAGGDVDITATHNVTLQGGSISAYAFSNNASVNGNADLSITAGHDIDVKGATVDIKGGFARASIDPHNDSKVNLTATADVNFTAGHDIDITGTSTGTSGGHPIVSIAIDGGNAYGFAVATDKKQQANAKASATVTFTAGDNIDLTAANGLTVAGGNNAGTGSGAHASATSAAVTVGLHADVSLTAANALSIKGQSVVLRGGNSVGGAFINRFHSTASTGSHRTSGASLSHATTLTASAKNTAVAVDVTSALHIAAGKGGLSLSGTTGMSIAGGNNAAAAIQMHGSASAAHVSDTIDTSVTIASKGGLSLKGGALTVRGGHAGGTVDSFFRSTTGGSPHSASPQSNPSQISGRGDAVMALNVDSGVTLSAVGSITATQTGNIAVQGASFDGSDMQVNISQNGTKGSTKITLDGGVDFAAGTALSLTGKGLGIQAGIAAASHARIQAYGGAVTWSDDDAVALSGKSVSLISSSAGTMELHAGNGGEHMNVLAGNAAKVGVSLDEALTITATGGNIVVKGDNLNAGGGSNGGLRAFADASNGATATLDQDAVVTFKASGLFSASFAHHSLSIHGGSQGLEAAQVSAKAGGAVARLSAEDSISITAASAKLTGRNVTVAAGRGANPSITHGSGSSSTNTSGASVGARGRATATLTESGAVSVAVTGALSILGSRAVTLQGANSDGDDAHVFVQGAHAAGTISVDGSLNVKAASLLVTAGNSITVGKQVNDVRSIGVFATQGGVATFTDNDSVNLTATKSMTLDASHDNVVVGGQRQMGSGNVHAFSSGSATLSANDGVNLKAGSVAFSAGHDISISGGQGVGEGSIGAGGRAKATFSDAAAVSITAATGFSAKLISSAASLGQIKILGANQAGSGDVDADTGGTAKLSVDAGVGINVTGATGTVDIDTTGHAGSGGIDIQGQHVGEGAQASGNSGAASINVAGGVGIAAKGAVTITNQNEVMTIGGGSSVGANAKTKASGLGGKAVSNLSDAVSISGGSVSITDTGRELKIFGGYRLSYSNSSSSFIGRAVGSHYSAQAIGPKAAATASLAASVTIKATGTLTLTASGIALNSPSPASHASHADLVDHAKVQAGFGGKAALTANASVNLSAVNVTLQAGSAGVGIKGQEQVADGVTVQGGSAGAAILTAKAGVNIKATGTLTINAGGLGVSGGYSGAQGAAVKASGSGAKAALNVQSGVIMSAKTVKITDLTGLTVTGGGTGRSMDVDASSGGANTVTLASQVSISASGALSVIADGGDIDAGMFNADSTTLRANQGKDTVSINSGVAFTAVGNMTLNMGGASLGLFGMGAGQGQDVIADSAGTVSENIATNLVLKSGAKLTLADINTLSISAAQFTAPAVSTIGNGEVSGVLDGSVSITGKSLSASTVTNVSPHSGAGFTDDGLVAKVGITVSGGLSKLSFAPLSLGTVQQDALVMSLETVMGAPAKAAQTTLFTPGVGLQTGSAGCGATLLEQTGHCLLKY